MRWYCIANDREQSYLPFYDPSEYTSIPQEPESPLHWSDPSEDPYEALEYMVDYHFDQVGQFLSSYQDIYTYDTVSFDDSNYEKKADPITVINVDNKSYVLDGEYIKEATEWINDLPEYELYSYVGYKDYNDEFWENPPGALWHGTNAENLRVIMEEGLDVRTGPRAMSNRSVGSAIFTSSDPDTSRYHYEAVVEINIAAMASDGYTPKASQEEPFEEENMKSTLASKIGIQDWMGEEYGSEGLDTETVVFFDSLM